MTQSWRISPVLIILVLVAGLSAYLYLKPGIEKSGRRGGAVPVVTHTVDKQQMVVIIEALGTAKANEAVEITAQQSEIVQQVAFDDGELVQAGQLLVKLSDREEKARVNELEVNLEEAQRQFARVQNLARENAASRQLLDEQEARVNALRAQLEVAQANLAELEVRAPFAGRLGIRRVSPGALVKPGDIITTLDDLAPIKVDFNIAEAYLPDVAGGQTVIARSVAYPGETFEGTIKSIDSRVDPVTRSVQVRALVDNVDLKLRPGMLLQINLQKRVINTLTVPEKAIVPIQEQQFVYVVGDDNKASKRQVTLGYRQPGTVQVINGLDAGEQVVVEGALKLGDGTEVSVLER
ncbi:uncharacterized protein HMF8227_00591 [Saliniradius amylolyticus]|uniref:Uncharacterized protein n=1 Tax=Saliniradius amylolyticus TaxID=2183582 RepID=A0A2S2E241_9ALTE|nr:efflux RND transporter periplasmic adaptor subunit [Saliniradius amylolyticus]AWL11087.1 uncharacterized protein HMF8227_00591 [Saliniradius amylolyticus]